MYINDLLLLQTLVSLVILLFFVNYSMINFLYLLSLYLFFTGLLLLLDDCDVYVGFLWLIDYSLVLVFFLFLFHFISFLNQKFYIYIQSSFLFFFFQFNFFNINFDFNLNIKFIWLFCLTWYDYYYFYINYVFNDLLILKDSFFFFNLVDFILINFLLLVGVLGLINLVFFIKYFFQNLNMYYFNFLKNKPLVFNFFFIRYQNSLTQKFRKNIIKTNFKKKYDF